MHTTINVRCVDQQLNVVARPVVAAGGINEITIDFTFCSLWDGFAKTAVFWNDETVSYRVLITDNKCMVPSEVTAKEGTFHFGVFGVKGDTTRTSTIISYNIKKGVADEGIEPNPTPSMYEQILAEHAKTQQFYSEVVDDVTVAKNAAEVAAQNAEEAKEYAEGVRDDVDDALYIARNAIPKSLVGQPNGVADLDGDRKIPMSSLITTSSYTDGSDDKLATAAGLKNLHDYVNENIVSSNVIVPVDINNEVVLNDGYGRISQAFYNGNYNILLVHSGGSVFRFSYFSNDKFYFDGVYKGDRVEIVVKPSGEIGLTYLGEGSSSSGGVFTVEVTSGRSGLTSDKEFSEIYDAVTSGKHCIVVNGNSVYQLSSIATQCLSFTNHDYTYAENCDIILRHITICDDGTVEGKQFFVAFDFDVDLE